MSVPAFSGSSCRPCCWEAYMGACLRCNIFTHIFERMWPQVVSELQVVLLNVQVTLVRHTQCGWLMMFLAINDNMFSFTFNQRIRLVFNLCICELYRPVHTGFVFSRVNTGTRPVSTWWFLKAGSSQYSTYVVTIRHHVPCVYVESFHTHRVVQYKLGFAPVS